jgi:hypothetical protein
MSQVYISLTILVPAVACDICAKSSQPRTIKRLNDNPPAEAVRLIVRRAQTEQRIFDLIGEPDPLDQAVNEDGWSILPDPKRSGVRFIICPACLPMLKAVAVAMIEAVEIDPAEEKTHA